MRKIYKYPLEIVDKQIIEIKGLDEVLSAGLDPAGRLCIWAIVNSDLGLSIPVTVYIKGTGHPADDVIVEAETVFHGSILMKPGLIWHVFTGR